MAAVLIFTANYSSYMYFSLRTTSFLLLAFCLVVSFYTIGCKKNGATTTTTADFITKVKKDTTWAAGSQVYLRGIVTVEPGATLTISPGTVVRGEAATHGTLVIKQGAWLIAKGVSTSPVVFTSSKDVGFRGPGDWGGVVFLGKAPNTVSTAAVPTNLPSGAGLTYGGTDEKDSSGVFTYVRIEFAGASFSPGVRANALGFYSVGSKTVVNHIQCSFSGFNSYGWYGGSVNCKNLLSLRTAKSDFYSTNGYKGNVQYGIAYRDPQLADPTIADGLLAENESTANFTNLTLIGPARPDNIYVDAGFGAGIHLTGNTNVGIYNSVVTGFRTGLVVDGTTAQTNAAAATCQVQNCRVVSPILYGSPNPMPVDIATSANRPNQSIQPQTWTSTDAVNWLTTTSYANDTGRVTAIDTLDRGVIPGSLPLVSGYSISAWNFLPPQLTSSAALNSKAKFTNSRLIPTTTNGFDLVTYQGAVSSTTDWAQYWTVYDPQAYSY